MYLPKLPYGSGLSKTTQIQFGGYNHTEYAADGELWDMENLTSDYAPVLSPREPRLLYRRLDKPNGVFAKDGLMWVDGTDVYFNGEVVGQAEDSVKTFGELGAYILILPDKTYYNIKTGEYGNIEASVTGGAGGVSFVNGTLYGIARTANTVSAPGIDFNDYFLVLDAVEIAGCTKHPENNKTAIIREISDDGHSLRFYENTFTLDGTVTAPVNYTEPGAITVRRTMPDLTYVCSSESRMWGCVGDKVYASKDNNIFNWNSRDVSASSGTLASSGWDVEVGSEGDFTGCITYAGYPTFFKDGAIYKVFGTEPNNFKISPTFSTGVPPGSGKSLDITGDILFYLSRNGVMSYSGGMPIRQYEAFGTDLYTSGVSGSDRSKYYISMLDGDGAPHLFVYDTGRGLWHREDGKRAVGFAYYDENLYMLDDGGDLWIVGNKFNPPGDISETETVSWFAEFADFTEQAPVKKGITKFYLRAEIDAGASVELAIRYDSAGDWQSIWEADSEVKRSYTVPIIPRRADHFRLKLSGSGGCKVYGLTRELYAGSAARSLPGRH